MHIIDELKAIADCDNSDPVVFISGECVWTLGMVIPMWQWVFQQSADCVCQRNFPF